MSYFFILSVLNHLTMASTMTHFIELERSHEIIENCYDNHYKSNVICSFMVYVLSLGLIMMGYMCQFYISLYAEELRKQTKIMTELVEFIETPFSKEESDQSEEEDSEEESDTESDSDTETEPDPELSEEALNKIKKDQSDDIREIMNHIFGNMGLNQT